MLRKRLMSLVLTLIMVLSLVAVPSVTASTNEGTYDSLPVLQSFVDEFGFEFAQNFAVSSEMIANLYTSFPANRAGDTIYPDDFGGLYVDSYGNLHILMVGTPSISAFALDARSNVRHVNFSLNELWETMNLLNDLIPSKFDLLPAADNATGWYLDVVGNRVVVELLDLSQEMIALFRETVFDSPILGFSQSYGINEFELPTELPIMYDEFIDNSEHYAFEPFNTVTLRPGSRIYIRRDGLLTEGSAGYLARIGGSRGFVTAAHIGSSNFFPFPLRAGDTVYVRNASGRQLVGSVRFNSDVSLQHIDAAFVTLNSNVIFDNRTAWCNSPIVQGFSLTHVGLPIRISGATTGPVHPIQSGTITRLAHTAVFNSHGVRFTVNNGLSANYRAVGGDSGGLVFNSATGEIIGIHTGRPDGITPFISTAWEINRFLNLQL